MAAKGNYRTWLKKENLEKIESWADAGLTNDDIAKKIGIASCTFYVWLNKYPEIDAALRRGKRKADIIVVNALYQRATGQCVTLEEVEERDANGALVVVRRVKKTVPPDVTAARFWLKNRQPDTWKEFGFLAVDSDKDKIQDFLKAVCPTDETMKELYKDYEMEKNNE